MAAVMTTPRYAPRTAPATRLVLVERAPAIRAPRPSIATYRRRRLSAVLLGLAMVVVAGRAAAGAVEGSAPSPSHRPASTVTYVVQPGDSLWSVAGQLAPHPRPAGRGRAALQAVRGNAPLVPGEQIVWQAD